jgi:hypothetical protein
MVTEGGVTLRRGFLCLEENSDLILHAVCRTNYACMRRAIDSECRVLERDTRATFLPIKQWTRRINPARIGDPAQLFVAQMRLTFYVRAERWWDLRHARAQALCFRMGA